MKNLRATQQTASESLLASPAEELGGRTIVGVPYENARALTSLLVNQNEPAGQSELALNQTLFKVRLADNDGRRNTASMLVKKMYAWRGYKIAWHAKRQPNRITLVASHGTSPMATISIGFDSPDEGLLVDDLYKGEVDALRANGALLCEFTKLAVDGAIRSKRVLATLFHISYIYGHRINGFTDLLFEVNPRHSRFYQQLLGCTPCGDERMNPRVNAPAVLLHLPAAYVTEQVKRFGGHPELARAEKSLFPYFFSEREEQGIMSRLSKLT